MDVLPFLEDIYPQDLLYAVTIRSPVARGHLKFIQVPLLPDNYTLVTARNIPGENRLEDTDMPILADGHISYIGEPIALLLGNDKTKIEELVEGCIIQIDEETPVFYNDAETAGAMRREINIGNIQETFEKTNGFVTGSYTTGSQEHWYAEPIGAVTWWDENTVPEDNENSRSVRTKKGTSSLFSGLLVVKTATQWPTHVKRAVACALDIDLSAVSVEPTALNLHMDGKLWYPSFVACHAALGTYITKKPVRLILNKEEDFIYTPKRCSSKINIATVTDEKGRITAAEINASVNLGAYGVNEKEILDQLCFGSLGFYNFKNLKFRAKAIRTNIPPQGAFSGFGLAQGFFAIERHISQVADMINLDPAEVRMNNIDPQLIMLSSKDELFNCAAKMSDYYRKWASYELLRQSRKGKIPERGNNPRGIGIAIGYQGNDLLYHSEENVSYGVEITLTKEGILEINSNIISSNDYNRIWEKIVFQTLSIEPEMVRIVSTGKQDCGPSCASRNITTITKLVEKCCNTIRKQRFREPLPMTVRRFAKPKGGSLRNCDWKVMDINGFLKPGMAAAVVEVSVDMVECIPVIRGVWLAVDGGKIISENRAKTSLARDAAQALGWAFTENIEYVNGSITRNQYDNYSIFSPVEIPPIHIDFLSCDNTESKGIGELAFTCIPSAFIQAVSQAMNYCFKSIPLKKRDIWEMIQSQKTETLEYK